MAEKRIVKGRCVGVFCAHVPLPANLFAAPGPRQEAYRCRGSGPSLGLLVFPSSAILHFAFCLESTRHLAATVNALLQEEKSSIDSHFASLQKQWTLW